MEESTPEQTTMEGEDEQEEMEEVMTVMPSIGDTNMKHYQMKLSLPKNNLEAYLIGVIQKMMQCDWYMEVNAYDKGTSNDGPKRDLHAIYCQRKSRLLSADT
jgi:hypothetical protein